MDGAKFIVSELAPFKKSTLGGKYFNWRGRMVRTDKYKYCIYSGGERNEQLFDMRKDRGETDNLINNPKYAGVIKEHREMLKIWIIKTNDEFTAPQVK